MRELHPGRLRQIQVQYFLEVLIHHVNHSVAESPQSKKQDEEAKGESDILSVFSDEHVFFGSFTSGHFFKGLGKLA